jgi:hypothetical protein
VDKEDQGVLSVETCEGCGRTFTDDRALLLHYEHGVKANMVQGPEDAHARFPERARCGNDQALKGKGLVNHFWMSVNGPRDSYWTNGPS